MAKRYLRCHSSEVNLLDSSNWTSRHNGKCGASFPTEADELIWDGKTFPKELDIINISGHLTVGSLTLEKDLDEGIRQAMIAMVIDSWNKGGGK